MHAVRKTRLISIKIKYPKMRACLRLCLNIFRVVNFYVFALWDADFDPLGGDQHHTRQGRGYGLS